MRTNRIALISAIIVALASQNASFAAPPQRGGPGGGPGRETRSIEYRGAATYDADAATQNQTYSSEESEVIALLVKGGVATVTNPTVIKKGEPSGRSDSYDFYGVNAAALATDGGVLDISGGSITTESAYSSGLFAYGTGVIKARGVAVATKEHNSGGVMVTGGGTLEGVNLNIVTEGGSSAAIRSDRGGGKLNIDGGSYTTNGPGSPAIYSTAEISVKNAELTATKSEGAIIEGRNSIALEKTKLVDNNTTLHGKSTTRKNIFIYQSFSGDAAVGTARFSAKDCEIVTKKGDSIYVTNTSCVVSLTGNTFVNEDKDGWFLRVQREGWGRKGSNGGNVEMTLEKQDVEGNVYLDNISTLKLAVTKGSHYVGAINAANTAKELAITLDAESTLELTADSYVSSIVNADPTGANIKLNGHVLHVGEEFIPDNLPETGSDGEFGPGAPPPDGEQPGASEGGFNEFGPPQAPNGGEQTDLGRRPRRPNRESGSERPRRPGGSRRGDRRGA